MYSRFQNKTTAVIGKQRHRHLPRLAKPRALSPSNPRKTLHQANLKSDTRSVPKKKTLLRDVKRPLPGTGSRTKPKFDRTEPVIPPQNSGLPAITRALRAGNLFPVTPITREQLTVSRAPSSFDGV